MTAAMAIPMTTTPAAAALTGVVASASGSSTAQSAGEDFAAALAALLNGTVATTQPHVGHVSKASAASEATAPTTEVAADPNAIAAVLPVVPGLILAETPTTPAQAEPGIQINAQAAQTSALQILQAAIKGTPEQGAAPNDQTASATPQSLIAAIASAPAATASPTPIVAANLQQQTQAAPAIGKPVVKPASSKETPGKPQFDANAANGAAPTTDSKATSNQHFVSAIEHALSNNGNGNGASQNGSGSTNQNAAQLPITASPVAIAIHTPSVETTTPGMPTPAAQVAVPLDTLAVHIARKFEGGENRFEIRLDPIELGKLDISMSVDHDGRVQAVVRAERPETLDMLQRDARLLENQLRQSGLNVDSNSLSFSLGNGNNQRSAFANAGQGFANAFNAQAEAEAQATATTIAIVNVRDGVDIRI